MGIYLPRAEDYLQNRRFQFVGQTVAGLQQINEALKTIGSGNPTSNHLEVFLESIHTLKANLTEPANVARFITPYGVYNNRGTHDGSEKFASVINSNVGNIIGVNISNYCCEFFCFLRAILCLDISQCILFGSAARAAAVAYGACSRLAGIATWGVTRC